MVIQDCIVSDGSQVLNFPEQVRGLENQLAAMRADAAQAIGRHAAHAAERSAGAEALADAQAQRLAMVRTRSGRDSNREAFSNFRQSTWANS
jgi:hypothetical protein